MPVNIEDLYHHILEDHLHPAVGVLEASSDLMAFHSSRGISVDNFLELLNGSQSSLFAMHKMQTQAVAKARCKGFLGMQITFLFCFEKTALEQVWWCSIYSGMITVKPLPMKIRPTMCSGSWT